MDLAIRGLRRLRLLRHTVLRPRRHVCGRSFRVPIYMEKGTTLLEDNETWLGPVLQVLLLRSQGAFVEAGTNVGATLLRGHVVAPASNYIGFEPNPACVGYVEELMRENAVKGPRVIPAALSDHEGVVRLVMHHPEPTDRTATLVPDYDQGQQEDRALTVPCLAFDDVAADLAIKKVGVVRLDAGGADLEALRGMRRTIETDKPALILRLPPIYRPSNSERLRRQEAIEALLQELGYGLYRVHEQDMVLRIEPVPYPIGIHGELDWSNHIALHRDRSAPVLKAFHLVKEVQRFTPGAR